MKLEDWLVRARARMVHAGFKWTADDRTIATLLYEERQRCAKLVEEFMNYSGDPMGEALLKKIRSVDE